MTTTDDIKAAMPLFWPSTWALMETTYATWDAMVDSAVALALDSLWLSCGNPLPVADPLPDLSPIAVQVVAAQATLALLPAARDQYMDGRVSESLSVPNGGGAGSITYYNKLNALASFETYLRDMIERYMSVLCGEWGTLVPVPEARALDVPVVVDIYGIPQARYWLVRGPLP